ncbi:uncharacterized protein B0H18DRAFT_1033254 [Fomitopsis serialis]|uniref:uncharacterized protein n=1 Tax=Fomitopsis serialis TaxID=139415 RepID=UPI00200739E8|nr:uncharacterized protein B0H18DRAFT_1033254 [Neoantrodia serialis]KAH9917837.1 hypothetical protein B0H18DRAFT_1033254 [Neoantrodia serialis]
MCSHDWLCVVLQGEETQSRKGESSPASERSRYSADHAPTQRGAPQARFRHA